MKNYKAQKTYLVFMLVLSVFISSSQVYGDSDTPGDVVSFAVFDDGAGMTNQGINMLVNGISGTSTASALVTGISDAEAAGTDSPSIIRTVNGKIRTVKAHSESRDCQESCSLN